MSERDRLLAACMKSEARITRTARAFYSGTSRELKKAFEGWVAEIEPIRELIADCKYSDDCRREERVQ